MKTERLNLKISDINPNTDNPRTITDIQLSKLIRSLKDMPEMIELRPLVVNEDNVVLGGNMRLKALTKMGKEEIPVIRLSGLTKEQEVEFVVKDNLSYGEWNWDSVINEYSTESLTGWGITPPSTFYDDDEEPEWDVKDDTNNVIKQITLKYLGDEYKEVVEMLTSIQNRQDLKSFTEVVEFLIIENEENRHNTD